MQRSKTSLISLQSRPAARRRDGIKPLRLGMLRARLKGLPIAGLFLLGLAACGAPTGVEGPGTVSRSLNGSEALMAAETQPIRSYSVSGITVDVPRSLRVSERNRYYPGGDIVWREDPIGDRHAQVAAIVEAGLAEGAELLAGQRNVILDVRVTRFHALTEKARYTVGGVHAIQFDLTVRDAETGEIIEPTRHVKADFPALGGMAAIAAEQRGVTQKSRITAQLAHVIRTELTAPDGYKAQRTGLMGAINQL